MAQKLTTLAIHEQPIDATTAPVVSPISLATTFKQIGDTTGAVVASIGCS